MLVFILLGLFFAGSSAEPELDIATCEGKTRGPHRNETDPNCQGYYFCLGNMKQSLSCEQDTDTGISLYYDPSKKLCTSIYKCPWLMDEATINEMCSDRGSEPQADKDDKSCRTYYVCGKSETKTTITKILCEDGTRFDPEEHKCTARYNDLCATLNDENSIDCVNKTKGPHAEAKDPLCKSYYYCMIGNRKETFHCDDTNGTPMFYDAERKLCTSKYKCEKNDPDVSPGEQPSQPPPQQQSMTPNNNQ